MDSQPATSSSRNVLVRLWPWLLVLAVLLFVGFIRVRLLEMPLERDEGEYAYAGQLILQGIPPYELAYNMKLPGTYLAYALGMAVFGKTVSGIHLTLILANSLTIIFVFLLGRKLFGTAAGLVACASYSVMSLSPMVVGLAAHATHFVVLFAVPATLLLLRTDENRGGKALFFSGLLYGLAFLMKQQGVCFCVFGWIFLLGNAWRRHAIFSTGFAGQCLMFGLGMLLPFGLTCLILACAGVFSHFWFWTFTYARSYVEAMPWSEGIRDHLIGHLQQARYVSFGFWILAVAGVPLALLNRSFRKPAVFAVIFWACSFLGTAIGLYFRGHYFILVLPAFAILIGLAVASLQRILCFSRIKNALQSLPVILFATILGWVIFYQAQDFFQLPPVRLCQSLYLWNPFVESLNVAGYIREHSAPGARIAVMGSEPEIYFYARRHSATGYIYTYALMEAQPNALKMQREMIREIEAAQPEYLVYVSYGFSWNFRPGSDLTILRWFDEYAGRLHEKVGIVQLDSAGNNETVWGEAAVKMPMPDGNYIAVYKLKSDLPATGIKPD
jgi:hypothetical protein